MVSSKEIEKAITKSIEIFKCHDYPKAIALKNFNEEDYQSEWYSRGDVDTETIPSPVGVLQGIQARLQERIEYESLERGVMRDYATNSFLPLNMMLNDVEDWEAICRPIGYDFGNGFVMPVLDSPNNDGNGDWVDMSMPQESEMLSQAIEKSPRVLMDSIVYRYGELPLDVEVGGHGKFKGFISTSYNDYIAFKDIPEGGTWLSKHDKEVRYKMRIFTPKGTKGVVLNRHTGCVDWQSELLLDKGQRYIVLAKNDNDMTADILLY